jgi:hypothetical protein
MFLELHALLLVFYILFLDLVELEVAFLYHAMVESRKSPLPTHKNTTRLLWLEITESCYIL